MYRYAKFCDGPRACVVSIETSYPMAYEVSYSIRPVINGSASASFQATALYGVEVIKKMQRNWIKSWVPRQDVTDQFNQHVQVRYMLKGGYDHVRSPNS